MSGPEQPPTTPSLREQYLRKADADGFVSLTDFSTQELGRQTKSIAALLDGEEGHQPGYNLGEGLRYQGKSGDYWDMRVHLDDLDEFVRRVRVHYRES